MKNKNKTQTRYGLIIAALLTAAATFAIMTYFQRQALSNFEKKEIYVALSYIPRGTVITEENEQKYLTVKSVDAGCIPESALSGAGIINGLTPSFDIDEGTLLTTAMFTDADDVLAEMESPVLAGFKTDDLSKAVSGVLRAGDRIDIYSADPMTGEGRLLCSNVYVECGYDSSGNVASGNSTAVLFNVYLENSDALAFYEGLRSGYMYVVKRY